MKTESEETITQLWHEHLKNTFPGGQPMDRWAFSEGYRLGAASQQKERFGLDATCRRLRHKLAAAEATASRQAKEIGELRKALQNLMDEQNGPPLIKREPRWQVAMSDARAALESTEPT